MVCKVSSEEEVEEIHDWFTRRYKKDQETFGTRVVSMDVQDVKATFYDTLRMAGRLEISSRNPVLSTQIESKMIHKFRQDGWRQISGKIMIGNGISW